MKKLVPTLLVATIILSSCAALCTPASAATEEEIEQAIANGTAWLVAQQQTVDPDAGAWRYNPMYNSSCYDVATTGLVVLKLEERAKELGKDPFDNNPESPTYYEYADNVIAGFDYIFQSAINDTNGVHFPCMETYSTAIVMVAVAASNAPDRVITTPGNLTGWTYKDALQGMMDWMTYSQQRNINFTCDEGGWDYAPDPTDSWGWADQSNTGYASLALGYAAAPAPKGFGLTVPQEVLDRLDTYIGNVQDPMDGDSYDGGSWYEPCGVSKWVNILKTGNLLYEMALVGDKVTDSRVQNATKYMENHWNDMGNQPEFPSTSLGWKDSYQAMFTMMKGFEAFGIETVTVGGSEINWFDNVSDVIVANQNPNGSWAWIDTNITEGEDSPNLRAAWALLTLEKVVPPPQMTPGKVTAGGFIEAPEQTGGKKVDTASFGFVVIYDEGYPAPKGELEYLDLANGTSVHAHDMTRLFVNASKDWAEFEGTCTINGEDGHTFEAYVEDNNEPGVQDMFNITLDTGYAAGGPLLGGNIQIHKKP